MPDRDKDLVYLFVRDLDDIELPARDRWRPAPRKESHLMRTARYLLYATAVAAVLVLALIAGFALRQRDQVAASPSPTPPAITSSPTPTAATATPVAQPGEITGALGYPSDFVPPLTVYAISMADQRVFFSVDTPRYGGVSPSPGTATIAPGVRPSYTITGVAPGTYYVLAYRNDDVNVEAKSRPGVYSQYVVRCIQVTESGGTPPPECSSSDHALVPVTVRSGQTASRIDVTDWYYGPQATYPPRPR